MPQSIIRRGIVIVLTMSGVALLDKAGWAPLGAGEDETYPILIAGIGLAMLVLVPLVWGFLRKSEGLPFFGSPTVARSRSVPEVTPQITSGVAGPSDHERQRRSVRPGARAVGSMAR